MRPLGPEMDDAAVRGWLTEDDPEQLARLFAAADAVRAATVGDAVHLRGLIEVSNACVRACGYCGLSIHHRDLPRYRMQPDEVLACARRAASLGYGTVVLQAGEDPLLGAEFVADLVRAIKRETGLAVTLSLGERDPADWRAWREAGADRYLLRFETSNPALYRRIHPPWRHDRAWDGTGEVPRLAMLRELQRLGYEAGTGVMVGIPGQTWDDLVADLRTFQRLDIEMIGIGPYIPHPATPLAHDASAAAAPDAQVPNDLPTTLKVLALARLLVPDANIPATTAVATLDQARGREDALRAGANVVMPNLTPLEYRALYEIYPGKAGGHETPEQCHARLAARIAAIGRRIGTGPGSAPKRHRIIKESA